MTPADRDLLRAEAEPPGPQVASRRLTGTLFAVALLAFLLPFGTVSCGEPVSFTGAELATASVSGPDGEFVREVEGGGTLLAAVAAAAAVVGLALSIAGRGGGLASGATSLIALLLLPWSAVSELADFEVGAGFELAVTALLVIVGVRTAQTIRSRRASGRAVGAIVVALIVLAAFVGVTAALCVDATRSFETAAGSP